ncbi:MAG: hypothetical protein SGPRY_006393 [Prymnesium sp.]
MANFQQPTLLTSLYFKSNRPLPRSSHYHLTHQSSTVPAFPNSTRHTSLPPTHTSPPHTRRRCTTGKESYRGRPADIWACGITLCMLLSGKLPFEAEHMPALFEKIQKEDPKLPREAAKPELIHLLHKLLRKMNLSYAYPVLLYSAQSPDARPTVTALRHDEWVTKRHTHPMSEPLNVTIDLSDDDIKRCAAGRLREFEIGLAFKEMREALDRSWGEIEGLGSISLS